MARRKNKNYGVCKICGLNKKLSDDHVPPQGGIEIESVEIYKAFNFFSHHFGNEKYFISQNGVKFTTICEFCNSKIGREFDTVLNAFAVDINKFLTSKLELPNFINIETKPNRLIRALLSHLLAAKTKIDEFHFDEKVRDFLFDFTKPVHNDINIFYWIYPYRLTIIVRDVLMPAIRGNYNDLGLFHIFKYYPVAFLVSDKAQYENLLSLNAYKTTNPDDVQNIPIRINEKFHWKWPEMVDKNNFVLLGKVGCDGIKAEKHILRKMHDNE